MQNLGPFVNILTADDKFSLLNRDNLTEPIQMQLSKIQKNFSHFVFLHFWNIDQNLNLFKKR